MRITLVIKAWEKNYKPIYNKQNKKYIYIYFRHTNLKYRYVTINIHSTINKL